MSKSKAKAKRLLVHLGGYKTAIWIEALKKVAPDTDILDWPHWGEPTDDPSYAFLWNPPSGLVAKYHNIKAVFSLGAGVDHLTKDPVFPRHVPVIRMSDEGLKEGMVEYIVMASLMLLRDIPDMIENQKQQHWKRYLAREAGDTRLGFMGFGALARHAIQALKPFKFPISVWSRTPKEPSDGITHFTGQEQLASFLGQTDILVGLLPETPETKGLLDRKALLHLPKGAAVINVGRGGLIDLQALRDLLETDHLRAAMLDVFPTEPLAEKDPLWQTKNLVITPHIAAITRPLTAARFVIDGIEKIESGELPSPVLNFDHGY